MEKSFYFYDLETTGLSPRESRIMQFAGQRTDADLNPIGDPDNFLIKQTEDILPSPDAVLVTGITPQKTLDEGITEDEFIKIFNSEISKPGTIFVGYNNISFDDEFMRFLLFRNFNDPYEWQYKDERSKWDMLDVIRITRALRPDGIKWPTDKDNKPTNKLELLAAENNILHTSAHDALSDVEALIGLSQLIKDKQPKLFNYLLTVRDKRNVADIVLNSEKFIYTSGNNPSEHEKTIITCALEGGSTNQGALIYNLNVDPDKFSEMTDEELLKSFEYDKDNDDNMRLNNVVKPLQFNRCPAVAPISVIHEDDLARLKLDMKSIENNFQKLNSNPELVARIVKAKNKYDSNRTWGDSPRIDSADAKLYDGFIGDVDKREMMKVHREDFNFENMPDFNDDRLKKIFPLYIARNFPQYMTEDINNQWDRHRTEYFYSGNEESRAAIYYKRIGELMLNPDMDENKRYLLEELKLWAEAIMPVDSDI